MEDLSGSRKSCFHLCIFSLRCFFFILFRLFVGKNTCLFLWVLMLHVLYCIAQLPVLAVTWRSWRLICQSTLWRCLLFAVWCLLFVVVALLLWYDVVVVVVVAAYTMVLLYYVTQWSVGITWWDSFIPLRLWKLQPFIENTISVG